MYYESQRPPEVPAFVKNHGLLPQPEFQQLLRKAKVSPLQPSSPRPAQSQGHPPRRPGLLPPRVPPPRVDMPQRALLPWGTARAQGQTWGAQQVGESL